VTEPPSRASLYDWECREVLGRTDQDLDFWLGVVATAPPGRVLEAACGTGRVSVALAAAGLDVVGIDIDPAMLAAARNRGAHRRPLLVAADMRRFALACRFGAALVPYNSIQLLTDDADVVSCLSCLSAHLVPGGVIGLEVTDFKRGTLDTDVLDADVFDADVFDADVFDEPIHSGELAGVPITLTGSLTHDPDNRIAHYRRSFSGHGWTVEDEVAIRSFRLGEIAGMLAAAGLQPARWWQDGSVTRVVGLRVSPGLTNR